MGRLGNVSIRYPLWLPSFAGPAPFSSSRLREQLSVLVNKHLFSHKYDYREWLNVIDQLSKPSNSEEVYQRALSSVTNIFKSAAGELCS